MALSRFLWFRTSPRLPTDPNLQTSLAVAGAEIQATGTWARTTARSTGNPFPPPHAGSPTRAARRHRSKQPQLLRPPPSQLHLQPATLSSLSHIPINPTLTVSLYFLCENQQTATPTHPCCPIESHLQRLPLRSLTPAALQQTILVCQPVGLGPSRTHKPAQSLMPRARLPPPSFWGGGGCLRRRWSSIRKRPSRSRATGATRRARTARRGTSSQLCMSHGKKKCPRRDTWGSTCVWDRPQAQGRALHRTKASSRRLSPCAASARSSTPACSSHRFTATTVTPRSRDKPQTSHRHVEDSAVKYHRFYWNIFTITITLRDINRSCFQAFTPSYREKKLFWTNMTSYREPGKQEKVIQST